MHTQRYQWTLLECMKIIFFVRKQEFFLTQAASDFMSIAKTDTKISNNQYGRYTYLIHDPEEWML